MKNDNDATCSQCPLREETNVILNTFTSLGKIMGRYEMIFFTFKVVHNGQCNAFIFKKTPQIFMANIFTGNKGQDTT